MARLLFALAVIVIVATVYTVIDCALRENDRIRGLGKPVWLVVILLLPVVGMVLWYVIGRARVPAARPRTPDDDPSFLGDIRRNTEHDERIRKIEEELAALDSESDLPDGPATYGREDNNGPEDEPHAPGTR
ncbi:PLDc N-terminal domain-containing protein [Mycetocola spongiae]|uniref:PLDc N-terminal domain-containing protein n=1 Tax=Mycetocola spongiae TaxID=2859226 RepID=UPI001CF314AC|nr:PLDc N-terminal domain-containing protein [Mycetocola spongiae]UCR87969.1 PLDc N-terminal domain-containing protein [Mycetocola spongiae]